MSTTAKFRLLRAEPGMYEQRHRNVRKLAQSLAKLAPRPAGRSQRLGCQLLTYLSTSANRLRQGFPGVPSFLPVPPRKTSGSRK
jgi:hypothetical protein